MSVLSRLLLGNIGRDECTHATSIIVKFTTTTPRLSLIDFF